MIDDIKKAVDIAQRAQRNYDLSKSLPDDHLETLMYVAANSPSKQNETHYSLHVYTDPKTIKSVYDHTKKFTLVNDIKDTKDLFGIDENGKYWQNDNQSVKNSQILANVLFVYVKDEGDARGGTHIVGKQNRDSRAMALYNEQIDYSIGISIGQVILSATLLGYRTGLCSAMDDSSIKKLLRLSSRPKMLVGIGFPNEGVDRRLHAEVKNSDVAERFRTGLEEESWRFPSFEKNIKVFLNDNKNS